MKQSFLKDKPAVADTIPDAPKYGKWKFSTIFNEDIFIINKQELISDSYLFILTKSQY